jgi:hypothetical protein
MAGREDEQQDRDGGDHEVQPHDRGVKYALVALLPGKRDESHRA